MAQLETARTTERLILRRHVREDLDQLAEIYASPQVNQYLYSEPRSRDETMASIERSLALPTEMSEDNLLVVAVVERASDQLVGSFILKWSNDPHRQGEVGGSLHPKRHGMGYASEVYRVLLGIGFDEYHLHRIVGRCDARNLASIRSLEKVGMTEEARLIENEFVKGEWTDEVILAIRASTWRTL